MSETALWIIFALGVPLALALDLGLLRRKAQEVSLKQAALWSGVWVTLALLFAGGIFFSRGAHTAAQFLTGYVVELSLSVDNVFLFAVIFGYFRIPPMYQHRVLTWGVLSAVALRGIMILVGVELLETFHWMIYVFGGFLILTGVKMLRSHSGDADPGKSKLLQWLRGHLPMTERYDGHHFFTLENGRRVATPLLLVLVMVELTDVLFALDSIPAILGITRDRFVVFTSNIFAILGLRSLYFLLAGVMDRFQYLSTGLAIVLMFVGLKMLGVVKIPMEYSLLVIAGIIGTTVAISLWKTRGQTPALNGEHSPVRSP